jgi:hypothetical protein
MPIDRNGHAVGNDAFTVTCPGAYLLVLEKRCSRIAYTESGDAVLLAADADALSAVESRCADRTAELMRQRQGQPVHCRSWELPKGLGAPFDRWRQPQCRFRVDPDDRITLLLRKGHNAS